MNNNDRGNSGAAAAVYMALGLVAIIALCGIVFGVKAFSRYQSVQDANNRATVARIAAENEAKVNSLRIAAQEQKVKITEQDAQIRITEAHGIKEAQDIISSTLTPLYVQMEMIRGMEKIASDGKNNTVIYIPVGPQGLPVVAGATAGK